MDQQVPEDVGNLLINREASLEVVEKSVKKYISLCHGNSIGRKYNCGEQGVKNCSCDFCDKSFGKKTDLQIHIATVHQGIKNYSCDLCDKSFGQKGDLRKHITTVHENINELKP